LRTGIDASSPVEIRLLFILPWAAPSIPTVLSIRFMLNPEWGIVNSLISSGRRQ